MLDIDRAPESQRLLDSVREVGSLLDACADENEQLRHLSPRACEAMREVDLFRCATPREVGGLGLDPVTQTEVFEAVTAAESAAGWNLMIGAIWDGVLGAKLPEKGVSAVFGADPWPITAGLGWPSGQAKANSDETYSLSGHWKFGSGIQQASWTASGCRILDGDVPRLGPDGAPLAMICVVPRSAVTLHDTWHVFGLRGTGSCDYSIQDVPVSEDFMFPLMTPSPSRGGAWWSLPAVTLPGPGHTGFALGVARRCLDEVKSIGTKRRYANPAIQAERESVQMELGRRIAQYEAVRLFTLEGLAQANKLAERGQSPPFKPTVAYATEIAVGCAEFAFRTLGADALFESHPVQRYLRDALAAQQHIAASDGAFTRYGKAALDEAAAAANR